MADNPIDKLDRAIDKGHGVYSLFAGNKVWESFTTEEKLGVYNLYLDHCMSQFTLAALEGRQDDMGKHLNNAQWVSRKIEELTQPPAGE